MKPANSRITIWEQSIELLRWFAICLCLSLLVGSSVALFLWLLDFVTQLQWRYSGLLYLLPLAGVASGLLYHNLGRDCGESNGWLYDRIQQLGETTDEGPANQSRDESSSKVPWLMAPLVMVGTLLTHLCGGSAGREGTAVQMGGSIAGGLASWLKLSRLDTAQLAQVGIAAGFGAVFGTPLAATLFAIEVVGRGVARFSAVLPCLVSAILADIVVSWWGIQHTDYWVDVSWLESIDPWSFLKLVALAMAFGSAAWLYLQSAHLISKASRKLVPAKWLRPVFGGAVVVVIILLSGSRQYAGLGVDANPNNPSAVCIVSSFSSGGAEPFSWLWKSLLTAITVGTGFKGGEATPLFFVGSTLGNALSSVLNLPIEVSAALGFVAVFASVTRTPLACTLMAVELFGGPSEPHQKALWAFCSLIICQIATQFRLRLATEQSRS